ncbi:hypothetical protein NDU88_002966 [Pleurodeles waltl]|uniref:Uncharacterized protein n=1 Tax=Pleurodeles waltl TaxID=8319 RepID=A0AAV7Q7M7_PLEWA|nr:hypothetical protein NDU88_002966 [Pleurodeles waltl]
MEDTALRRLASCISEAGRSLCGRKGQVMEEAEEEECDIIAESTEAGVKTVASLGMLDAAESGHLHPKSWQADACSRHAPGGA